MKLPGIFVLTKHEQRAIIVIVMALLAATIAKHYRDYQIISARSTSAETNAAPSPISEDAEIEDDESD